MLGTLQLGMLAAIGYGLTAAVVSGAAFPLVRRWAARRAAPARARLLAAYALAPAAAGILLGVVCFLPSVLDQIGLGSDHCLHHGHHAHFCLTHATAFPGSAGGWALIGAAALAAVARLAPMLATMRASARVASSMRASSRLDRTRGVLVCDAAAPCALALGWIRPQVVASTAFLREMPAELVAPVLEHERAHAARRDALRIALASLGARVYPARVRQPLLRELSLACEMACDEVAAARAGGRLRVASALVAAERVIARGIPALPFGARAIDGADLEVRVRALLADAPARGRVGRAVSLALAVGAASLPITLLVAFADPLHHWTESAIAALSW